MTKDEAKVEAMKLLEQAQALQSKAWEMLQPFATEDEIGSALDVAVECTVDQPDTLIDDPGFCAFALIDEWELLEGDAS